MSEFAKNLMATVLAGIILGSLSWVNYSINSLTISVNSSEATRALQWSSIDKQFDSIRGQMWGKSDAASADKILELRFKVFEDRLTTLEVERSEYLRLLRSLTEESREQRQTMRPDSEHKQKAYPQRPAS